MRLNKTNWLIGFLFTVFIILIGLSVIFYRERLLADSGYYLIRVINSRMPWVEHGRTILFFSQVLPWLGVLLHMPLKAILLLYSLNHVLFPLLIFYLVAIRFNNPMAGVLLILLQLAGMLTGFLVPMFELYYAASMLVLFAVILYTGNTGHLYRIFLLILAFFIMGSHPVGIALLLMVLVFHATDNGKKYRWFYVQISILLAGLLIFKYFTASEYEEGKSAAIIQGLISGKYNLVFFTRLAGFLLKNYFTLLLIGLTVIVLIVSRRWYLKLVLYLVFIAVFVVLSALNTGVFELSRYIEQVWFPLVFVISFPLMIGLTDNVSRAGSLTLALFFLILVTFRLWLITDTCRLYTLRTDQILRLTAHAKSMGGSWYVIDDYNITDPLVPGANWSYPIETMLLSSQQGPAATVSICTLEDYLYAENFRKLKSSVYLFRRFEVEPLENINRSYFNPAAGPYVSLNDTVFQTPGNAVLAKGLTLNLSPSGKFYKCGKFVHIPVEISTTSLLPSNRIYGFGLVSVWENAGKQLTSELVTPMEVDVRDSYTQEVFVKTPETPGSYTLKVSVKEVNGNSILVTASVTVFISG